MRLRVCVCVCVSERKGEADKGALERHLAVNRCGNLSGLKLQGGSCCAARACCVRLCVAASGVFLYLKVVSLSNTAAPQQMLFRQLSRLRLC